MINLNTNFNNEKIRSDKNQINKSGNIYVPSFGIQHDTLSLSSGEKTKQGIWSSILNGIKNNSGSKQKSFDCIAAKKDFESGVKAQQEQSVSLTESKIYQAVKHYSETAEEPLSWMWLANEEYGRIRQTGKYAVDYGKAGASSDETAFLKALQPDSPDDYFKTYKVDGEKITVLTYENENWNFRGGGGFDAVERLSANVKPEAELIKELDIFMKTGIYTDSEGNKVHVDNMTEFMYKTSRDTALWNNRQDPVTMYFNEKINADTYKAISEITKRYARGMVNNSNSISPWLSRAETYVTKDMCNALAKDLSIYSRDAAAEFESFCRAEDYNISTGIYHAYQNIVKSFELYLETCGAPAKKAENIQKAKARKNFENGVKAQMAQSVPLEESPIYKVVEIEMTSGQKISASNWKRLASDDEYKRIRQINEYAVDYGEAGISSDETTFSEILKSDNRFGNGKGFPIYTSDGKKMMIPVRETKFWNWRGVSSSNVVERLSANVKPEAGLIYELDTFMDTGIYTDSDGNETRVNDVSNFYYKTASDIHNWNNRQDPVTIYFKEKVNAETYKAISDITERYARGIVNNANTNSPWLSNVETHITKEMCSALIKDLSIYSINAAKAFQEVCLKQNYNLSTGEYEAFKNIFKSYKQYSMS